jgi:hypothetical protein
MQQYYPSNIELKALAQSRDQEPLPYFLTTSKRELFLITS